MGWFGTLENTSNELEVDTHKKQKPKENRTEIEISLIK